MKATASTDQSNLPAVKQETLPADPVERANVLVQRYKELQEDIKFLEEFEKIVGSEPESEFKQDYSLNDKQFSLLQELVKAYDKYQQKLKEVVKEIVLNESSWYKRFSLTCDSSRYPPIFFPVFVGAWLVTGVICAVLGFGAEVFVLCTLPVAVICGLIAQIQRMWIAEEINSQAKALLTQGSIDNKKIAQLKAKWRRVVKCHWLPKFIEAGKSVKSTTAPDLVGVDCGLDTEDIALS